MTKNKKGNPDTRLLKGTIQSWLGIKEVDYQDHDITNALNHAGVTKFIEDFTILTKQDIVSLVVPARKGTRSSTVTPLSVINKRLLKVMLAFYHDYSRRSGQPGDVSKVSQKIFHLYRITQLFPSYHGLTRRMKTQKWLIGEKQ